MFNPKTGKSNMVAGVPEDGTFTGSSVVTCKNKAFVIGGVNKEVFKNGLTATGQQKTKYMTMPPADYGFTRKVWSYDPSSSVWECIGISGKAALAGAGAVMKDGSIYMMGGEIKPGVRTPTANKFEIK
jgi:sialate O-acetylesterase